MTYSVKQASIKSGISLRMIQYYCNRDSIQKKGRSYAITEKDLIRWSPNESLMKANETTLAEIDNQIDLQVQSLELEVEKLKEEAKNTQLPNSSLLVQINQDLKQELENLKQENRNLKEQLTNEIPHQEKLKKAIQLITLEAMEQGVMHKVFTDEEYNYILGTISQVKFHQEQVKYLKNRIDTQDKILTNLTEHIEAGLRDKQQRNLIEALDKGYDKKEF